MQTGLNLGGMGLGQKQQQQGGLQLGGLGGATGLSGGQGLGLNLGQTSQAQGLKLGGLQGASGLQLGQQTQAGGGGLQLGQGGGGLQLGQQGAAGGLKLSQAGGQLGQQTQTGGGLQLGQTSGGLQLGQTSGGLQLGQMGSGLQQQPTQAPGGLKLGQVPSGGQLGTQQAQTPGGLQLGQQATGGLQVGASGLKLGQQAASGLQGQSGLKLGQVGGLQIGQPTTAQTTGGLKLGQTAGGTQIGQQTPATSGLQLHVGQQAPGGLKLGQSTGGLQIGQQQTQVQPTPGLQAGQQAPGGLQIGQTTAAGLQSTLGGLKMPQASAAAPITGLPTQTTTSLGLTLGKISTGTTAPTTQLGGLGSLPKTTAPTTQIGGLGGLPAGLKLNTTLPSTKPAGTSLTTASSAAGGLKLGTGTTTTSAPTSQSTVKGLGGVDPATITGKGKNSGPKSAVDTELPDVLNQLVANYEQFLKGQKEKSDEISKFSGSGFKKIKQDTSLQQQTLAAASSQIAKASQMVGFLKNETAEELMHAEVAQRTQELPAGLQHENTAPDLYFQKLVSSFEAKMILYKREIEELESHLSAITPEAGMTPQNVIDILQLQYKPFLILAAQLQTTHERVETLKEQYLSYRRIVLQDTTDVFEERRKLAKKSKESELVPSGPSPFSSTLTQMSTGLTTYPPTTGVGHVGAGIGTGMGVGTGLGGLSTSVGGSGLQPTGLSIGSKGGGLSLGGSSLSNPTSTGLGLKLGGGLGGGSQPTLPTIGVTSTANSQLSGAATNNLSGGTQPFMLQKPPPGKRRNH